MDICLNFMERWAKQAGKLAFKEMHHLDDHGDIHLPAGYEVFLVRRGAWGGGWSALEQRQEKRGGCADVPTCLKVVILTRIV